ncbi:MAG: TRL domain-containing protein [Leptospiraceae bacterium]|nr:TRL domain-containing protein [Leptospiraceae bacterium]
MTTFIKLIFFALFTGFFANCSTPFNAFVGMTSYHVYGNSSQENITSNQILRSGESCSYTGILIAPFYYGSGNSVDKAMKEGKITKVSVIDRSTTNYVGPLYVRQCTIVWGE